LEAEDDGALDVVVDGFDFVGVDAEGLGEFGGGGGAAVAAGKESSFSWSGTASILGLYVLVMVPGGAVAGLTTRRLRWLLPGAGALFLCGPAIGVASEEVGGTGGFGALQWLGVGAAGAAVFATIGLLPLLTVRLADRWLGRRRAVLTGSAVLSGR
jgi:hypothetical protein